MRNLYLLLGSSPITAHGGMHNNNFVKITLDKLIRQIYN